MKQKQQKLLTDSNEKGNEQMKNNKKQDEFLFYPRKANITEDIAVQKVIMSANEIIDAASYMPGDLKITFGYRALNKLLFSHSVNKTKKFNMVSNCFKQVSEKSIEDIAYCIKHEHKSIKQPQMYFNREIEAEEYRNIALLDYGSLWELHLMEETDPQSFLGIFKGSFNLFDLMIDEDSYFAEELLNSDLINFYFKFDINCNKSEEIEDTSTMKVVFQLANDNLFITYTWTFNLKLFLVGKVKPKMHISEILLETLVKDSCIERKYK